MAPDIADDAEGDPSYAFRPSPTGAMSQFILRPDALEWQIGGRSGRTPYDRIHTVRLSYRPVSMQAHRFVTEIQFPGRSKIQIASVSWRSMVEQERLDRGYAAFITELHRRLASAGVAAQFSAGLPATVYWIGAAMFAGVMIAMAVLIVRALQTQQWSAAAVVVVFFVVFALQIGNYFRRNRPGRYRPDAIPAELLPNK